MRRGPYGGGFIFFAFYLFIILSNIIYGLGELLFPLIFMGVIGYSIASIIKKQTAINNSTARRVNQTTARNINANNTVNRRNVNSRVSKLSNADLNLIDKKLAAYFKNNLNLPVIEGIGLTTQSGKFTTANQLYLTYKDEKILKLDEFKNKYYPVYDKIMQLLLVFARKSDDVLKAEVDTEVKKKNVLSDADKYIDRIDALNNAIPQEEITNGLYQTCDLLKQIDLLKETKNDENKVKKLYDYYMPILIDVLERYKKLQDSPNHGDEFKKCEAQLIKTIILINEALKTIGSSMQEDDYMNINADISTLQSLLQKDGYGNDPFGDR